MIKAGAQNVSDIVITLPDGSAIQTSGIKSQDVNVAITSPIPSVVYNESTTYNNLEVKLVVSGVETSFKTTGQSGVPLSNADLLNIRRLQPEAIVVESISGVTTGTAGALTQFKNFYPFNNDKFKLGRNVVASPISSVKYFAQKEGEQDVATKIENAFGVDINELIVTSGNDTLLSGTSEQVAKDLDIIVTALEKTIEVSPEQVFRNIAKELIAETTPRSGINEFIEAKIVNIATSVKKEALDIPTTGNLNSEELNIATNIANNIVNIRQVINESQNRGNAVEVASVVANVLNTIDITQPSGTVASELQTSIESEIETELGNNYVPLIGPPQAPVDLNVSVIELTTTTTTAAPTTTTTTTAAPGGDPGYLVSGAGTVDTNGTYCLHSGNPESYGIFINTTNQYSGQSLYLYISGMFNGWAIGTDPSDSGFPMPLYYAPNNYDPTPPLTGWSTINGDPNPPTLSVTTCGATTTTTTVAPTTTTTTTTTTSAPENDPYYSNVSLLLNMDGTNDSTSFTDNSVNSHSIVANGNAKISTAQSKVGNSSAYFDGNADYLSIPSTVANFGSSMDFTIEFWLHPLSWTTSSSLIFGHTASNGIQIGRVGTNNNLGVALFGITWYINDATLPPLNTWTHVAVTRQSGVMKIWINGEQSGSSHSGSNFSEGSQLIGGNNNNNDFHGYIDQLRISKGVSRYNNTFTPLTSEYPTCCTTTTTTPDPSLTPTITQQPLNNYSSLSGSEAIPFAVTATGPSGMTYQWQVWDYDQNWNQAWINIPNKTSNSITITGDELAFATQYNSDYFRDTKIRCVISAAGFSDIVSNAVYFDKYHRFGGYVMTYDANYNSPQGSEQINGVFYQVLNSATGPIMLEIYEMVLYSYDLSWVTGNDMSLVLQESSDATNWSNVSTTSARGIPYAAITIPSGSGTKYYRVSITINWPLNVNNGTGSANKPSFTFPSTTYSTELKVIWA